MRTLLITTIASIFTVACGGGSTSPLANVTTPSPTGSGGGSGGGGTPVSNYAVITVDAGPANSVDEPFVSVSICAPNDATQCQTINHILVDTGSSGLRIMSSVLSIPLPIETDAQSRAIVECTVFADGYSWGPVKHVDLTIGGEHAGGVPMQVIGDPTFGAGTIPRSCSSQGPAENDVQSFGANGVLGVGPFVEDCGSFCATSPAQPGAYYTCVSGNCEPAVTPLSAQVVNPVALFSVDNNGVLVDLPAVPAVGTVSVTGSLIFGIGTESNNALGNASVFLLDPTGSFVTVYKGVSYSNSYIDSGSDALYFNDRTIPVCSDTTSAPGFFCPATVLNLSAVNSDVRAQSGAVNFSVANADALFTGNVTFTAFANLAGPNSDPHSFDWGLPFFFGRRVFTAIDGRNTPGGVGPYFAY